jgi:hypothetical protein
MGLVAGVGQRYDRRAGHDAIPLEDVDAAGGRVERAGVAEELERSLAITRFEGAGLYWHAVEGRASARKLKGGCGTFASLDGREGGGMIWRK